MPAAPEDKSIPVVLTELKNLTIEYAKQETLEPAKGLGRFVLWGIGGAFVLAIGCVLWALALLRLLQTETGRVFAGNLAFVPYLLTIAFLLLVAAVAMLRVNKGEKKHQERKG